MPYWKLSPASLADIMQAERYFDTLLPNDLVNFLLEFDGDGEFLYSTKEIIETTRYLQDNPTYQNLCFIGQDGEGNHFCYQILDDGSIYDECIYLCKNPEEMIPVTDDLQELIYKYYSGLLGDEDIAARQQSNAYNKFVEWWSNVDEKSIENDEQLLGAYQVMWYYNEVCNGGLTNFGISRTMQNGTWSSCGKPSKRYCPNTNFYISRRLLTRTGMERTAKRIASISTTTGLQIQFCRKSQKAL